MSVRLSTEAEYFAAFPTRRNVYGSQAFTQVTRPNAEAVRFFISYDEQGRPRMGIIAGYRGGKWYAPYSAPFTEIAYNSEQHLERIYEFISELTDTLGAPLQLSLPPDFYDREMLARITGILTNYATKVYVDFDYYYPLERLPHFTDYLSRNSRKNYNRALAEGFSFTLTDDAARAYAVIKANRDSNGYPLAMSLEQVKATVALVPAEFFVLSLGDTDVAAALVYRVTDTIAQVIYWGDAPGYSHLRPMNMLPYHVFKYYYEAGYKVIDIGPSSSQGIPSSGLCRFKESIGCLTALKPTFTFE